MLGLKHIERLHYNFIYSVRTKFQILILSVLFIAYRTNLTRRLVCDVEVIMWFAFSKIKNKNQGLPFSSRLLK